MTDQVLKTSKHFNYDQHRGGDFRYKGCQVTCPVCGFNCTKAGDSVREHGRDNWETSAPAYRGDLVRLPFSGECGHNWELCFGFHKGETFAFVRMLPDSVELS